jgi:lipid-binding SYLF domain-containing protein
MKHFMTMIATIVAWTFLPCLVNAQKDNDRIMQDSKEAKAIIVKTDPSMQHFFNDSYGYVVLPNVGKGAAIVGGAGGNGTVYERGKVIGTANMLQATVGAQIGGQAYREVIFFENKEALDRFKGNKIEFSGQVSAVAVKEGASANVAYREGVAVFTQAKEGLMAEASIGGQKFTYKSM